MKGTKKTNYLTIGIVGIIFICFLIMSIVYIIDLKEQSELRMSYYLQDVTHQRKLALGQQIESDLHVLEKMGIIITEMRDQTDDIQETLLAVNADHTFLHLGVVDLDGNADMVTLQGETYAVSLADAPSFASALEGMRTVSDVYFDERSGAYVVEYTVPIMEDGRATGALSAIRSDEVLQEIISSPITTQSGSFFIVNETGTILLAGTELTKAFTFGTNLFSIAEFAPDQLEAFANALKAEQTGRYTIWIDANKYFAAVEALDVNDWMLVSIIDHQSIEGYYNLMLTGVALILSVSSVIALFLLYWQACQWRKNQEELETIAYTDPITGGMNATKFRMDAQVILANNPHQQFAVWTFDTKNFTRINDFFGEETGNRVLKRFYSLLSEATSGEAIACRIGSDIFAGIRPYTDKREIEMWFWAVIEKISNREVIEENQLRIDNVMGVYCTDDFEEECTVSEMISRASAARHEAKRQAGDAIMFFTTKMQDDQKWRAALEASGKTALQNGEITFFLQPKVDIHNGYHTIGAEALARWNYPGYGWIPPIAFIPIFEQNGFIVNLDRYIFEQVCIWYASCKDKMTKPLHIAVNISRQGFLQDDIIPYYVGTKEMYGIEDGVLELEFTESMVQDDHALFLRIVTALQSHGFTCAIDDFGAGYSSLNLLRELPIDVLKLDAGFFRGEGEKTRDQIVVESFIQMAKQMNISTVAEGVEKPGQVSFLEQVGCDIIQGYVFSKPMPKEAFEQLIRDTDGEFTL